MSLTFDARDPHTINDATHRRDYFTYCEHKLGRMSIFDPRRKGRTHDGKQPEPGQDPDKLNLRPDEVTRLRALIQDIEQSARPLSSTPTLGDKARQDAKESIEEARKGDPKLPDYKKAKDATHDAGEPLALGHGLYTHDAADPASPYQRLGHDLYS